MRPSYDAREWATATTLPQQLQGTIFVTVHPDHVARAALETVSFVVAVGVNPESTLRAFCGALGEEPPEMCTGRSSVASHISGSGRNAGSPCAY
jgi:hypothetical protein